MCNLSEAIEERALEKGIDRGQQLKLISLVCKKYRKGLSPEDISDFLEEDLQFVKAICDAIEQGKSEDEIVEQMMLANE